VAVADDGGAAEETLGDFMGAVVAGTHSEVATGA
jgi:hypothetical protein